MSYASAMARVHYLESRFGLPSTASAKALDATTFDKALANAQVRFGQGPARIINTSGSVQPGDGGDDEERIGGVAAKSYGNARAGLTPELDQIFKRAAAKHHVPEALIKAVARAESGFRADAVSPAGAQGLMQLMPATGRGLGVTDPFNPEQSINGGARYLRNALDMFDGNQRLALAAYNAGPNAVKKHNGIPPYAETQNYVQKVMAYAREFGLASLAESSLTNTR